MLDIIYWLQVMDTDWSRDNVCNSCYLMVVTVTAVFRNTERSHGEPHESFIETTGWFSFETHVCYFDNNCSLKFEILTEC